MATDSRLFHIKCQPHEFLFGFASRIEIFTLMHDQLLSGFSEADQSRHETDHIRDKITTPVAALMKKHWLIKVRRPAAIVEFLVACVIWAALFPIWKLARKDYPGSPDPNVTRVDLRFWRLAAFFAITEHPTFVMVPDCVHTRTFVSDIEFLLDHVNISTNISLFFQPQFADTVDEMRNIIYSEESNGLGIHWVNCNEDNAMTSPVIQVYKQAFGINPDNDIFELMTRWIALRQLKLGVVLLNTSYQRFATPPTERLFDIHVAIAFFCVIPVIITTMPDIQTILEEKDSRVQTMTFLMGCSESAYWGVSFVYQFVLGVIPYVFMCASLAFNFAMKGTDFTLMLTLSVLFVIGHIWFQMLLTSFLKKAAHGRMVVVMQLVFTLFFAYLHFFLTIKEENESDAIKHVLSLVPMSAYEIVMMVMYQQCQQSLPAVGWGQINEPYTYRVWWALFWLFIDCIVYFLLFCFFNLVNDRDFGSPLLRWRELCNPYAWNRVCRKRKPLPVAYTEQKLLDVKDVSKTYHGERKVVALRGVSFHINAGEVIVIIGPNGAGKSTLMNILSGAIEPTQGTLSILGGVPSERFKDIQDYLGVCFQENVLIDLLSIREHFRLFGAFRQLSDMEILEATRFFCDTLQLTEMLDNRAGDLSGGQKRKLCIAISLLGNPPIVIMDEPTAGVDVQSRQLIWKTIAKLKDTTTIVTSHALEEAEAVSSRLFVVAGGKMPFAGTSTELRKQFKCGYILRVEGDIEAVLEMARSYIPEAHLATGRSDTIEMEVCKEIPEFIRQLEARREELGVTSFSFSVEQLEDVLLKLIETEESAYQGR